MRTQNPTYTQSYQPIERQNPRNTDYFQPTQMQNEIPLPYYLQQHKITKSQLTIFSKVKCRRITTDDYESIPHDWIIKTNKQAIDGIHWHRY